MATINFATREITAKIVYFGARGAGCNTNVARLHALVDARRRGELDRVTSSGGDGEGEHALSFDYLSPRAGPIEGFGMAWQVWSLPGGLDGEVRRDQILRGADAVVFVADARHDRNDANVDALLQLEEVLARMGQELSNTTVVLQVNHTDAEGARPQSDVIFDLNPYGFPVSEAVAADGAGIVETHTDVTEAVVGRIADVLSGQPSSVVLTAVHDPERNADTDLRRHQETSHPTPRRDDEPAEVAEVWDEPEPYDLPEGPQIEVPFQPRDFAGYHPVQVLGAEVEGDRVWVELLMERMGGGEARRLSIALANRPTDTPPAARASPVTPEPKAADEEPSVFHYLPESAEIGPADEEGGTDLPGIWYGVLGVAGGLLIGILLSFLLGAFT
ncbi:MAG: GTPase domain-containing protein [Alphaproteobacteria bacterium]|nr:GTPase domain-containing protein [Alphaproteobacteria bacterium]MCB9699387.1 GTPase domain-containing protein [Alphaproteobacteria bacterium]